MQIKNTIILLQFKKEKSLDKRHKQNIKLYLKLLNPSNNPYKLMLPEIELFEDESFRENTEKYLWKTIQCDKFDFIKGKFYDEFKNGMDERIVQCSNICLLNEEVPLDNSWYEVKFLQDGLELNNSQLKIIIKYKKNKQKTIITSANILLDNNNSPILIDSLLYLKELFYYSNIVFNYIEDKFTISDIAQIINIFSWKPVNTSTIRRRFNRFIERVGTDTYPTMFKQKT